MTENSLLNDKEYADWITSLKSRIRSSQIKASIRVNSSMLELYWNIGAEIYEKQTKLGWGSKVIPQLSADLRSAFPDSEGYSVTNLKLMKRFYTFYCDLGASLIPKSPSDAIGHQAGTQLVSTSTNTILAEEGSTLREMPLAFASVPWRHHVEIIRHCDTMDKALFFVSQTVEHGWSRGVLLNF